MADYIIATDSGCDLTAELYEKYDVRPIMLEYELDGKTYEDTLDPKELKEFYNKMREGGAPKTSQLNTVKLEDFFETLLKENNTIVYLSLGSGISGSYNNARLAANAVCERIPESKIIVIDTNGASMSYGLLVIEAAKKRAEGKTAEEMAEYIESIKFNVGVYYTTKDLTYLHRGGRVSGASKVVAHMLGINPVLTLDHDGHLIPFEKVRGEKATFDSIGKNIRGTVVDAPSQTLYISQADCMEKAEILAKKYKEEVGFKDVVITNIGAIIGAHTGPGLVALFYLGTERK